VTGGIDLSLAANMGLTQTEILISVELAASPNAFRRRGQGLSPKLDRQIYNLVTLVISSLGSRILSLVRRPGGGHLDCVVLATELEKVQITVKL
jgi:hypothetical protein